MKQAKSQFIELIDIIEHSREKCPYVRHQTPTNVLKKLREETNEIEDALKKENTEHITEEISDVLWNTLMLIHIYEEKYNINVIKSLTSIKDKMIRRRPHVFGHETANTPEEALAIWNRIKSQEKKKEKTPEVNI